MDVIPCYRRLRLYTTKSTYSFVPTESADRSLVINRKSGEIRVESTFQNPINSLDLTSSDIYGIVGIIALALADYIIVITGREFKGKLLGHEVFRATSFQLLSINPDINPDSYPTENYLLGLLKKHLDDGLFWLCYTWDLTQRLQAEWMEKGNGKMLWEIADERFFWNRYAQTRLIDIATMDPDGKIGSFILPIMFGTFDIRDAFINGRAVKFCLVSRRSRHRAGTRYFRRGVDSAGHVANFNETEQIVVISDGSKEDWNNETRLSYVQVRGSVPLYWAEVNNLRYKPELQVMEFPDSENAMRLHLQGLAEIYGEQSLVNLVNCHGYEQPVKEAFERYFSKLELPGVRYEYFDYHTECRNKRVESISLLIKRIEDDLTRNEYFCVGLNQLNSMKLQKGVVRTNCMDNLDRTNVTQSAVAKWILNRQLRDVGILHEHESVDDYEAFMNDFRNMWADHADLISKAYSGTGALKTDFTRTGKRTWIGIAQDGLNSVMRYLRNNFLDGPRQDGFDLFTGNWVPRPGAAGSNMLWLDTRPLIIRSVPPLALLALFMICAGLTLPRSSDYSLTYWFLLWISLLAICLAFIFAHGVSYVAWPRLNSMTDIINYNGPGFIGIRRGRGLGMDYAKLGNSVSSKGMGLGRGLPVLQSWNTSQEIEMGTAKKRAE